MCWGLYFSSYPASFHNQSKYECPQGTLNLRYSWSSCHTYCHMYLAKWWKEWKSLDFRDLLHLNEPRPNSRKSSLWKSPCIWHCLHEPLTEISIHVIFQCCHILDISILPGTHSICCTLPVSFRLHVEEVINFCNAKRWFMLFKCLFRIERRVNMTVYLLYLLLAVMLFTEVSKSL